VFCGLVADLGELEEKLAQPGQQEQQAGDDPE
jgi:hypothetical protein